MRESKQPADYSRKAWENFLILQAIWQAGLLKEGSRGLGFGVGREFLPEYFASKGCSVVATDIPVSTQVIQDWVITGQHSGGDLSKLKRLCLCDDEKFLEKVSFKFVNMRDIPPELSDFDFTWSAGALDHLGTLEEGLRFFKNSLRCLKPGGIAAHTTEYNLSSNDSTISTGSTVFYRKKDLEEFYAELRREGFILPPLDLSPGTLPYDVSPDIFPYKHDPHHLCLVNSGLTATSVIMLATRGKLEEPALRGIFPG